jgi:hypothetical protein
LQEIFAVAEDDRGAKAAPTFDRGSEAVENKFYQTRAEDGGFIFITTKTISENKGCTTLTDSHETQPQGAAAKLQSIPMRLFFKGVIRKALLQDLSDIKAAVEQPSLNAS